MLIMDLFYIHINQKSVVLLMRVFLYSMNPLQAHQGCQELKMLIKGTSTSHHGY